MGTTRWTTAFIALAALTALGGGLVGCAQPAPVPPPPTPEEIEAVRQAEAQTWWDAISTGTTMPDIEVIAELPMEKASAEQAGCLADAELPGVTIDGPGSWSFDSAAVDEATAVAVQLQWWVCAQQYPVASDDWAILSPSQLDYLYSFFVERHLPCLRSLGVEPAGFPTRDDFLQDSAGFPSWLPHEQTVRPIPNTNKWLELARRCPLPEMLHDFGLPGYGD